MVGWLKYTCMYSHVTKQLSTSPQHLLNSIINGGDDPTEILR